jgi:hypothetical protein
MADNSAIIIAPIMDRPLPKRLLALGYRHRSLLINMLITFRFTARNNVLKEKELTSLIALLVTG